MGKVRRLRQKYHVLLKKDNEKKEDSKAISYDDVVSGDFNKIDLPMRMDSDMSNPFANIKIDIDDLKTKLEDDCVSVCSNSVIKRLSKYDANGKLLKKDEIRKRRHELFLKKLDIVNQARLEVQNKKKKKKTPKNDVSNKLKGIEDDVPVLVPISKKKNSITRPVKKRGIEKRKKRKQNMLEDIAAFHSVISEHKDKTDVYSSVTECVLRKVLEEAENE